MQVTESDITEFRALCKRELGVDYTESEAEEELRALLTLVRFLVGLD